MGTPGKGMLLPTGKKLLISSGKPGLTQTSGVCCECGCCLGQIWYCVCGTYGTLTANGTSDTIDVLDCCEGCGEVAATLELWVTCTDTVVTLNWEYVCGATTDSGTADISDLCDEGEIKLFPDITVAGCTFVVSVFNYAAGETCCGNCLTWDGGFTAGTPDELTASSTETNPEIPADPDDYLAFVEGPYVDLVEWCAGAEVTFEFVWRFGRNAQTRTVWVEWTHGGCLEYVSNDPEVTTDPNVTHDSTTVTETATTFKVEWTYTDAAGEGAANNSITFRVLSCCDCDFSFKVGGETDDDRQLYTEWLCS